MESHQSKDRKKTKQMLYRSYTWLDFTLKPRTSSLPKYVLSYDRLPESQFDKYREKESGFVHSRLVVESDKPDTNQNIKTLEDIVSLEESCNYSGYIFQTGGYNLLYKSSDNYKKVVCKIETC